MKFYKNNAYPEIILHDCDFKMRVDGNDVIFDFPKGLGIMKNGKLGWTGKGKVKLSGCSADDLDFISVKRFNLLGIHRQIVRYMSVKELEKFFKSGHLELVDEYYAYEQFLWVCSICPCNKRMTRKYGDDIIIRGFVGKPLEYYFDEREMEK